MPLDETRAGAGWSARLALAFEARDGATVLARRSHAGPLVVQKALHPEGREVCHAILVHPPSGVCGGDTLDVRIDAGAGAHALVTTPGAGKWYRSAGARAAQRVAIGAGEGAVVEWLPQETIVYDGADASLDLDVALAPGATFVGLETLCLGRTASGERFARGRLVVSSRVTRDGALCRLERGVVAGGSAWLDSPAGFAGQPVTSTLVVASPRVADALVGRCREEAPVAGRGAVTRLSDVLVARWLGPACEPARAWMVRLWSVVRPAVTGRPAIAPRIWNT